MGESRREADHRLASDLRMATFRLARRLRAQRAASEVTDAQHLVLGALRHSGPRTPGELAERERITAPSMNRTVNELEARGLVTRSRDANDGRKVIVTLTDAGAQIVEATIRQRNAWLEEAFADLSDDDRVILSRAAELMTGMAAR